MRLLRVLVLLLIAVGLLSQAARFLVVDDPRKSDAIVVLAGETNFRPVRGLELLRHETAPRLLLDAESGDTIYDQRLTDVALRYISTLPDAPRIAVCPINGRSTSAETEDVQRCLQPLGLHSVVIVTSEFHTRRALEIFRKRLPQYQFSAAAARDSTRFGLEWWTRREWAKVTLDEWIRLIWWEVVDRWR